MPNSTADQLTPGVDATIVAFAGAPFGGGASLSFSAYQIVQGGLAANGGILPNATASGYAGQDLWLGGGNAIGGNANGGSTYVQLGLNQGSGTAGSFNVVNTSGTTVLNLDNNGSLGVGYGQQVYGIGVSYSGYLLFADGTVGFGKKTGGLPVAIGQFSTSSGVTLIQGASFGWGGSASDPQGGNFVQTLSLFWDAADTLAQRRGLNAQTFRLYETYTDASNYARMGISYSGGTWTIKPEAAGTGTVRSLQIGPNLVFDNAGNISSTSSSTSPISLVLKTTGGSKGLEYTGGVADTILKVYPANNNNHYTSFSSGSSSAFVTYYDSSMIYGIFGNRDVGTSIYCRMQSTNSSVRRLCFTLTSTIPSVSSPTTPDTGEMFAIGGNGINWWPSTPSALAADTDNLQVSQNYIQRLSATGASRNLTGITVTSLTGAAHIDGRVHRLINVGSQNIVLKHNTTSTAANRFYNSTGADITLAPNQRVEITYDATDNGSGAAGWRVSAAS